MPVAAPSQGGQLLLTPAWDWASVTTAPARPRGAGTPLGHSPAPPGATHSDSRLSITYYKVFLLAVDLHCVDRVEGRLSWVLPLDLPPMRTLSQAAGSTGEHVTLPRAPAL